MHFVGRKCGVWSVDLDVEVQQLSWVLGQQEIIVSSALAVPT